MSNRELQIESVVAITEHDSAYYNGFFWALEHASYVDGKAFVTLAPAHIKTIKQLLFDYGLLECRRKSDTQNTVWSRRAQDLSANTECL